MGEFPVVEIDNDIGTGTVKDEGGGVTSLDVNVRSGNVNVGTVTTVTPTTLHTIVDANYDLKTISCNNSTYTLFYTISYSPDVSLQEVFISSSHMHRIKVDVDSDTIFDESLSDLQSINFDSADKQLMEDFSFDPSKKTLRLKLCGYEGSEIKIYCKHLSGTGNLSLKGYLVVYRREHI